MTDYLARQCGWQRPVGLRPAEFWAVRDFSLRVAPGECVALIGPNGAGKTTLLKLIARELDPTFGSVRTRGRVVSFTELGTGLNPQFSGRENIYLRGAQAGLSKPETDRLIEEIVDFAGLGSHVDAPVKTYSSGMYARLEFAVATARPPDVLLIDELLAVGDVAFQAKAMQRVAELKKHGTAVLFVSHSEISVRLLADRCVLLFDGVAVAEGPPDRILSHYYRAVGLEPGRLSAPTRSRPRQDNGMAFEIVPHGAAITVAAGQTLTLTWRFRAPPNHPPLQFELEFWNPAGQLIARVGGETCAQLDGRPAGGLRCVVSRFPLTAGAYRVALGIADEHGRSLAYRSQVADLIVVQSEQRHDLGLFEWTGCFELTVGVTEQPR